MKNIFMLLLLTTCSTFNACKKENNTEDIPSDPYKTDYPTATLTKVNFEGINNVLIMGNSITMHGAYPSMGWYQNCGMAASCLEKDYVHLLSSKIHGVNPNIQIKYERVGNFEIDFLNYDTTFCTVYNKFKADLIIIQFGENINDDQARSLGLRNHIVKLVNRMKKNDHVIVCLTNSFWPKKYVNDEIQAACHMGNYLLANVADLYADRSNTGEELFANPAVASHPGDKGMNNIAERIWNTIGSTSYPVIPNTEKMIAPISLQVKK